MTPEQQRALAIASARLRQQQTKPEPAKPEAKGMLYAAGSGMVRSIPQAVDLGGALVAEGADRAMGGDGGYFEGFLQPKYPAADALLTQAIGPEYDAQGIGENVAKFAGGVVSPFAGVKAVKNAAGFVKGFVNGAGEYITDPKQLRQLYVQWEKGLENIPVTAQQVREGIVDPFMQKMQRQLPFLGKDGREVADAVQTAERVSTDAGYIEGMRKALSGNPNPAAQVARKTADEFMQSAAIPTDGRDAYRRFKMVGEVDDALRNLDNETIKATRTKINNIDKTGATPAELEAFRRAGRSGIGEGLLRALPIGRASGAITGAGAAVATGNPIMGGLIYAGGRGLESLADRAAMSKIDELRQVLMNGRPAPNLGERAGGAAKEALKRLLQGK